MNSTELLEAFRDEMADVAEPYLWSDAAIYRYIDDAQKMFCRLTDGIEDSRTVALTQLDVVAGQEWLDHSPLILKIREAVNLASGRPFDVVPLEKTAAKGIRFDGRVGPPRYLVSGMENGALRLYPIPHEDFTLALSVFRLPLERITDAGLQDLEVDEQHHEALLLWAKHKAYDKQDSEVFDRSKSEEYATRFREYCGLAEREQNRVRHPAGTTIYGGL